MQTGMPPTRERKDAYNAHTGTGSGVQVRKDGGMDGMAGRDADDVHEGILDVGGFIHVDAHDSWGKFYRKGGGMSNKHGSKWIRPKKRERIYARDGYTCCYCNVNLEHEVASRRTLDHIIPRAHGGSNAETNLVTCCITCNSTRRDTPLMGVLLERAMAWATRPLPEGAHA